MLPLHVATILIYLTSCLTSGSQEQGNPKSNGDPSEDLIGLFGDSSSTTEIPVASPNSNDKNGNVSKSVGQSRTLSENDLAINLNNIGPKIPSQSSERTTIVAEGISVSEVDLTPASDMKSRTFPQEHRSKPRKSAAPPDITSEELTTNRSESGAKDNKLPIAVSSGANETSTKLPTPVTEGTSSMKKNTELKRKLNRTEPSIKIEISGNKTVPQVLLVPSQANSSVVKHMPKPKPTATVGEGDDEQRMPPLPTEKRLSGVPTKIDYIVPIVISVMAVPLLAIGTFVLYKRSRDCWDRRHYRRMDFLIDGMYND